MTARAGGRPQASPVTCGVDAGGRIVVSTYPEHAKTRNARRDPRVSVLILSDDFGGP
jgi:nitroimidazol reductase NimA-like FMN-containing flavoprotein (pyridoxamine 5'-phosphate oxidase superfamily)